MLTGARSCWSVVSFVWLSGFHRGGQSSGDRADHRAAEGHRAKGPELRRQILCRFHKCLVIVPVCLLAFIHVCGPFPMRWCHPVSIIDSWRFIFSALPSCRSVWLLRAPALAQGHSIRRVQWESNTGSRLVRGVWSGGGENLNTGAAFLRLTPGFFTLWCEEGDECSRYVCQILGQWSCIRRSEPHLSINVVEVLGHARFGRAWSWLTDLMQDFIVNVIFCTDFLTIQLRAGPAMIQSSSWPSATVTLVSTQ